MGHIAAAVEAEFHHGLAEIFAEGEQLVLARAQGFQARRAAVEGQAEGVHNNGEYFKILWSRKGQ